MRFKPFSEWAGHVGPILQGFGHELQIVGLLPIRGKAEHVHHNVSCSSKTYNEFNKSKLKQSIAQVHNLASFKFE